MKFIKKRLGPYISQLIMPAQRGPVEEFDSVRPRFVQDGLYAKSINTVASTQGATIDVFEVRKGHGDIYPVQDQNVFIHLHGNNACYEWFKKDYEILAAKNPGHRIVGFNCRNVRHSQGIPTCEEDWIDDAVAVIRDYEKKGIRLENIILHGHSLGGAILTMAAAKIYQEEVAAKGKQNASSVKVLNDRSFSTIPNVVAEWLSGEGIGGLVDGLFFGGIYLAIKMFSALLSAGVLASVYAGFIATLYIAGATALLVGIGLVFPAKPTFSKPFIRLLLDGFLSISFGRMDALSAYQSLPDHAKDHIMTKDDLVILSKASLHHGLRPINSQRKKALRQRLENAKAALVKSPNNAAHLEEERYCTDELLNLKDSKLLWWAGDSRTPPLTQWAHNNASRELRTYHKNRGKEGMPEQIDGESVVQRKMARMF